MHTIKCAKRTAPPLQLTLDNQPERSSKRQRLSHCAGRQPRELTQTSNTLKILDFIEKATPSELNNLPLSAEKKLRQLSIRVNQAIIRLSAPGTDHTSSLSPPASPLMTEASHLPGYGYRASNQGVVDGTGVVAERHFSAGDRIAEYTGNVVYRIKNTRGCYHVFSVQTCGSAQKVQFHQRDTFAAWSGIYLQGSGKPGIEVGRDGDQDIRFLNHSKNANVQVVSEFVGRMNIHECNKKLLMMVVALKDINPGEELVFDYDPSKPDAKIDFSLTTVELPGDGKARKIMDAIKRIYRTCGPIRPSPTPPHKCINQQVMIPASVDKVIGQIMTLCEEIQCENGYPAEIDELMTRLSTGQKKLLSLIFFDGKPDLARIEKLAHSLTKTDDQETTRLTVTNFEYLKQYLKESFFNNKQTWITTDELKQQLHRRCVLQPAT